MTLPELTNLGDKIDIQLVQQLEMQERGELDSPIRTYKSSIFDYISERQVEIAMPTENGRMVLFQVGLRCKLLFYTKRGLYTCRALVEKRYKKENFFVLAMKLLEAPVKFQRREFFRLECTVDVKYIPVTEEVAYYQTTEKIFRETQNLEYLTNVKDGITLDISGGGSRFVTSEQLEAGGYILMSFRLTNDKVDKMFYLVSQVVFSEPRKNVPKQYVNRTKFLFKDLKDREAIVQFVFEEERKIRRKEIG